MISVIVPVYNVEKYLRKCLDSIVNQTYKDLEIILIDDGSTDSSGQICDEYGEKDKRIVVFHQNNKGLSAARNKGISLANAPFITFVDSDDYIELDTYECVDRVIKKHNPDIVFFREKSVDTKGKTIYINGDKPTGEICIKDRSFAEELIIGRLINGMCDKVYRASLLKDIFFKEGFVHGEDYLYNITVLNKVKTVGYIDQIKYSYVSNPKSITRRSFDPAAFDQFYFKDKVAEIVKDNFPNYYDVCRKRSFLARLRVCRPIYSERLTKEYSKQLEEINAYLSQNYSVVKSTLSKIEWVEYFLYSHCKMLYYVFLFVVNKRKH